MNSIVERLRGFKSAAAQVWAHEAADLIEQQAERIQELEAEIGIGHLQCIADRQKHKQELAALRQRIADVAITEAERQETALAKYKLCTEDEAPPTPLERLRFFCSLAMNGQDWLDVEPFFDAITEAERQEPVAIVDDAGVIIVCRYSYKPGDKLYTTPQPAIPAGYALVPVDPTEEMIDRVIEERYDAMMTGKEHTFIDIYKAMLRRTETGREGMKYIKLIIAGTTGFLIGAGFVWNLIGHTCSDGQSQWFATSLWGKFTCMPIRNMK